MRRGVAVLLLTIGLLTVVSATGLSAQKPVTLNMLSWSSYTDKFIEFADQYMKERFGDHVHVTGHTTSGTGENYMNKLVVMLASSVGPDVYLFNLVNFMPHWVESNYVLPLDGYLASELEMVSGIAPPVLDAWRFNGNIYGIPMSIGQYAVYYNRDRFNEIGLGYPDDDWAIYGGFLDAINKLQEVDSSGALSRYGISVQTQLKDRLMNYIMSNGGHVVDDQVSKAQIAEPAFVDTIQLFLDLSQRQIIKRGNSTQAFARFVSKEAAMFMSGVFYQPRVTNEAAFNWGVAPVPRGAAGRRTNANTNAWFVNPQAAHVDLAAELAKAFATPEYAKFALREGLELPVNIRVLKTDFLASLPRNLTRREGWIWLEAIDYMRPYPKHDLMDGIWKIAESELSNVWAGRAIPANALRSAADRIDALLQSSQ